MSVQLGFFEKLYTGEYDPSMLVRDYGSSIDEKKVEAFMEKYTELISRFPALEIEKQGAVPDELMQGMREIGLFGLLIHKKYGGLGFSVSEYLRVVEGMARHDMALVLVPLAHLSIGLKGIILYGTEEQKKKYLTPAASGEMIFGYALTEPKTGSDAQHVDTWAKKSEDGSHWILNGTKTYITNANYAGGYTVFAQLDPENRPGYMGAFIVERAWDGITVGADMAKMGLKVSSTGSIRFKDVKVPAENLLAAEGDGFKVAMNILNYGRLGLGAASAGLMKQSVKDMLKRSETRKQFSMPIGEFELIQEKVTRADAHWLASKSMTYFTAKMMEDDHLMNVAMESSHTKLYGTDMCWNTLYDALQTAGGSGFLESHPYEKRMRDFRVTTIFEGTSEIHSIYPALTVFRTWGKLLKSGKKSKGAVITDLPKARIGASPFADAQLKEGMALAKKLEKRFRKLASLGLRKYGKKVATQEYFLRSMTRLNMAAFALIASASMLDWQSRSGKTISKADRGRYAYLIQEAREELARIPSDGVAPLESLSRDLWKEIKTY
jgi:acyl-CoA dehydrogenase family protein 9